jgi:hypothetical protein
MMLGKPPAADSAKPRKRSFRPGALGFLFLLMVALPPVLLAWRAPANVSLRSQAMDFVLEGKITRKAPGKVTVNTGQNIVFTVRYDDETVIKKSDGSPGSGNDLRVGIKVRVEGELTESGEVVALKIKLGEE